MNIESHIRHLQGADFDPEPETRYAWRGALLIALAVLGALGAVWLAWAVWGA